MKALKFFSFGFATALILCVGAAFGLRLWLTAQYRADQALWRRIPIGFVVQDDLGIPALIKQGEYSHVSAEINPKNFPLLRKDAHIANMGLFTPKQEMDTKTVLAAIKARQEGVPRPATLDECLQYGAYIAALKSRHLFSSDRVVICLGQSAVVNGACVVPQLWSVDYGRWNLGTTACDSNRSDGAEFLVVFTRPPSLPGRRG
ncbi:MAG: hypothetical protein JO256_12935 [Alphaproteobacteria bacterium]|nr:hypothetical protein [Alphaproteobacteria bacterium]